MDIRQSVIEQRKSKLRKYFIVFTIVSISFYGVLLWIDATNSSSEIGSNLKFDWVSSGCSLGAMLASTYLGLIATVQNEDASKQNERLAKINEDQLENAILSQGYPQIRFSKIQRLDKADHILHIRIIDVRNIALKKAHVREVWLQPLSEKYQEDTTAQKIKISDDEIDSNLQLTYLHEDIEKGLYMIDIPIKEELLNSHRYYRLEFQADIISVANVVSKNKCFALLDTNFDYNGMKGREYFEVYHQFFEVKEILSEEKYKNRKSI